MEKERIDKINKEVFGELRDSLINIKAEISGEDIEKVFFYDDGKTFRVYYKDGCVTDGEII